MYITAEHYMVKGPLMQRTNYEMRGGEKREA